MIIGDTEQYVIWWIVAKLTETSWLVFHSDYSKQGSLQRNHWWVSMAMMASFHRRNAPPSIEGLSKREPTLMTSFLSPEYLVDLTVSSFVIRATVSSMYLNLRKPIELGPLNCASFVSTSRMSLQ